MKVDYSFTTGEKTEVDVSEEWGNLLLELDSQEHNNNRKETRRHISSDVLDYEGDIFSDLSADTAAIFENEEILARLRLAISKLQSQQQELVRKVFFEGRTLVSIASEEGVNEAAIRNRLKKIYEKMKKF